jgi:hypothetical protein
LGRFVTVCNRGIPLASPGGLAGKGGKPETGRFYAAPLRRYSADSLVKSSQRFMPPEYAGLHCLSNFSFLRGEIAGFGFSPGAGKRRARRSGESIRYRSAQVDAFLP